MELRPVGKGVSSLVSATGLPYPPGVATLCRRVINAGEPQYRSNLQGAVDACPDGGVVFLPPLDDPDDTYVVAQPPLRIERPNVTILGAGISSRVRLEYPTTAGQPGRVTGILIRASGSVLLSSFWLSLDAVEAPATVSGVTGIAIAASNRAPVLLRDISIRPRLPGNQQPLPAVCT